jgi:hypothetical protein
MRSLLFVPGDSERKIARCWDSGADAPPLINQPPRTGDDPHDNNRRTPAAVFSAVFAGEYSAAFLFVFAGTMDVFGG